MGPHATKMRTSVPYVARMVVRKSTIADSHVAAVKLLVGRQSFWPRFTTTASGTHAVWSHTVLRLDASVCFQMSGITSSLVPMLLMYSPRPDHAMRLQSLDSFLHSWYA